MSDFKNNIHSAGQDFKNFRDKTNETKVKVESLGSAMVNTGKVMSRPSISADKFMRKAVKTAADFEYQMDKVQSICGANDKEMKSLEETAREWGTKTKFSAIESAQAMEYMGMA